MNLNTARQPISKHLEKIEERKWLKHREAWRKFTKTVDQARRKAYEAKLKAQMDLKIENLLRWA